MSGFRGVRPNFLLESDYYLSNLCKENVSFLALTPERGRLKAVNRTQCWKSGCSWCSSSRESYFSVEIRVVETAVIECVCEMILKHRKKASLCLLCGVLQHV